MSLAGCAAWSPTSRAANDLLAKGDTLAAQGEHGAAISAYSEVIGRYPETPAASRARILREALVSVQKLDTALIALRRDLAAREVELGRLQRDVATRDLELTRLRTEIGRLASESERLRADLDQLKRSDLRLEQRRR
jgi:tetratricopeptide (TPR) repeat protein